jgi:hypothetical protein
MARIRNDKHPDGAARTEQTTLLKKPTAKVGYAQVSRVQSRGYSLAGTGRTSRTPAIWHGRMTPLEPQTQCQPGQPQSLAGRLPLAASAHGRRVLGSRTGCDRSLSQPAKRLHPTDHSADNACQHGAVDGDAVTQDRRLASDFEVKPRRPKRTIAL